MTDIRPAKSSSLKVSDGEETRPSLRIMQDDAEPDYIDNPVLHPMNRRKTGSGCCGTQLRRSTLRFSSGYFCHLSFLDVATFGTGFSQIIKLDVSERILHDS